MYPKQSERLIAGLLRISMPRSALTVNPVTQEDIERGILSVLKKTKKAFRSLAYVVNTD
ncbi:MAG: hypothetical protein V2J20_02925 [Wenzhouxiangella sp.]|jgi:hypothetical protein|nr:hypothetical protein [Wenzhouxiangella sp.]